MKIFRTIILFALFLLSACSPKLIQLKIEVVSKSVSENQSVFITGNNNIIGGWNPSSVQLNRINDSTFSKTFEFEKPISLEFKFTKGSWDSEAVDSIGSTPPNYTAQISNDTTIEFKIDYWKDQFDQIEEIVSGQITGNVNYHKNIKYKFLVERDLIVWLPPNYEASKENYPVLYMHDGQNIFDPKTSAFGIDWQIDEAAESLIKQGEISPIIIVGIYNSKNRSAEYLPSDTSLVYMKFITEKIKPMIDSLYRTKPEREFTATGGSSAGGTIAMNLLWNYNNIFSKAICMSPAFKINKIDFVSQVNDYGGIKKDFKLYIYNGGISLEKRLQPGIEKMIEILESKGYKEHKDFIFVINGQANHNESAWADAIPYSLKWLFAK